MKKILALFMAAAALTALASCQKEALISIDNNSAKTGRIISVVFANEGTKTTLGANDTPLWSVGDVIRVLDGSSYQDITLVANGSTPGTDEGVISADSKSFSFATTLTGETLYAVYPASATTMTSCTDGNVTFTVPSVQDGTFGSANICVASGDGSTANTIYFSNATAVVEMSLAAEVVYASLSASNKIAGDMTVEMGSKGAISSTTTTSLSSNYIFVEGTPSDSKFYLAVAPVETGAVAVTCNTSSKSGSTDKATRTLAMDKIYAMDLSGMTINTDDLTGQHGVLKGQEYVLIKAKYDGKNDSYLKWATQNLAVTESGKAKWNGTNYVIGDYFQWAASYAGYGITSDADKIPANLVIYDSFTSTCTGGASDSFTFKQGKSDGFKKENAPYYNGTSYTKYTSTSATLDLSDDVANIVLGGSWRMPTGGSNGQFKIMLEGNYIAYDASDKAFYLFKPGVGTSGTAGSVDYIAEGDDKTKALLFFPATGTTSGKSMQWPGINFSYWSSMLSSTYNTQALGPTCVLWKGQFNFGFDSANLRHNGFHIRPVSD